MKTLEAGDKIPNFESKDQQGNPFKSSDLLGNRWVIFFYPKANTPGCTAQACNLRDNYSLLESHGYKILGISADSPQKQTKFKDKYNLPFPLLADDEKSLVNTFGVWGEKKFMGKTYNGIHRITFVVDQKGVIEHVIDKVKTKNHSEQILNL